MLGADSILFTVDEEFHLPGVWHISFVDGYSFVYYDRHYNLTNQYTSGVMTLDGREIVPPTLSAWVTTVTDGGRAAAFIVSIGRGSWTQHPRAYMLIGTDGGVIAAGQGIMEYDTGSGLISVLGKDYFKWLDKSGNVLISIPFLSYTFD
jgi:hypothetical protein